MLQFLHGIVGSWFVKILFVMLIASFLLWGINDIFRGGGRTAAVITVDGTALGSQVISTEFQRQLKRYNQMSGASVDERTAIAAGLPERAAQSVAQRMVMDREAMRLGVVIGDDQLGRAIKNESNFLDKNGHFDAARAKAVLRNVDINPDTYMEDRRGELARGTLLEGAEGAVRAPRLLAEALYRVAHEKRSGETLTLNDSTLPAPPAPVDADLDALRQDEPAPFTAPERATLTVARLSQAAVMSAIPVSDQELQEAYDAHISDYAVPERRSIVAVRVPDETMAKAVLMAAGKKGGDLEAAAKINKLDAITYPEAVKDDVPTAELADAAFAMDKPGLGEPVKTALGWSVFAVTKVLPAGQKTLDEVRPQLLASLRHDRATDTLDQLSQRLDKAVSRGDDLETLAKDLDLVVTQVEGIDNTGHLADGSEPKDLPQPDKVAEEAFKQRQSTVGDPIELDNGDTIVVRVDTLTPAHLRPLDEVRADVTKLWEKHQSEKAAADRTQAALAKLHAGASTADVAAEFHGVVGTLASTEREPDTKDAAVPGAVLAALFRASPGDYASASIPNARVIVHLTTITPADISQASAAIDASRTTLDKKMSNDILEELSQAVQNSHKVVINQQALAEMYPATSE